MSELIEYTRELLWSLPVCLIFIGTGLFLTLRLRFFQLVHLRLWLKQSIGSLFSDRRVQQGSTGAIAPFSALTTALAATMGTGNIVGMATAIALGGPGALFWLALAAFLGMMTKFCEITLALTYRVKDPDGNYLGGPMFYLHRGLNAPRLAKAYAFFCLQAACGIGNITQGNSLSQALLSCYGTPPALTGVVLAAGCLLVILGGVRRIGAVTALLIPLISLLYIGGCLIVLALNAPLLPQIFKSVIACAFGFDPALGGLTGFGLMQALRYGVARGVFSNEAGLGSSAIAHAASTATSPVRQAMWGCFEVFADTLVVCSLTALVILCAQANGAVAGDLNGAALTIAAFAAFFGPNLSSAFISLSLAVLAFSTLIGWCYYGQVAAVYLWGSSFVLPYRLFFCLIAYLGCRISLDTVWALADIANALMALPNLICVLLLSGVTARALDNYLKDDACRRRL